MADKSHVMGMATTVQQDLQTALEAQGFEVLAGKGGFWLRGHGHITTAQARRMTGIAAEPRVRRERFAYGDYAQLIALINRKAR
jgi:hypothetical protein